MVRHNGASPALLGALLLALVGTAAGQAVAVQLQKQSDGSVVLARGGQPYYIKCAPPSLPTPHGCCA